MSSSIISASRRARNRRNKRALFLISMSRYPAAFLRPINPNASPINPQTTMLTLNTAAQTSSLALFADVVNQPETLMVAGVAVRQDAHGRFCLND